MKKEQYALQPTVFHFLRCHAGSLKGVITVISTKSVSTGVNMFSDIMEQH